MTTKISPASALAALVADRTARATEARDAIREVLGGLAREATAESDRLLADPSATLSLSAPLASLLPDGLIAAFADAQRDLAALAILAEPGVTAPAVTPPPMVAGVVSSGTEAHATAPAKKNGKATNGKATAKPTLTLAGATARNYYSARKYCADAAKTAGELNLAARIHAAKTMGEVRSLAAEAFEIVTAES